MHGDFLVHRGTGRVPGKPGFASGRRGNSADRAIGHIRIRSPSARRPPRARQRAGAGDGAVRRSCCATRAMSALLMSRSMSSRISMRALSPLPMLPRPVM